jgi:hypothetical protein
MRCLLLRLALLPWALLPLAAGAGYQWRDVPVFGGGFVSGIVYNQGQPGGLYLRTDVGGAYRWNGATGEWIPLTDYIGEGELYYDYVLSLASDPTNPNQLYLAVGGYAASWAGNGAILISTNRGDDWSEVDLPIKLGGNDDGHYTGERLQVDPNQPSTLYLGTTQNGLWLSLNSGASWAQVAGLASTNLNFVCVDASSGSHGNASQRLIVGTMETGNNIWMTTNGGGAWGAIRGQPAVYYPMRFALASNLFYVTYASANGQNPDGATNGAIYKYNLTSAQWSSISPPTGDFGFGGICVDKANTNKLVAGTIDRWYPGEEVYRSTNGGATWTGILRNANINGSEAPYTETNFMQNWICDIEINPFNSNEAWFDTGYGVFVTEDLTDADAGRQVTWTFQDKGLEETVVAGLVSPPTGPWLLTALADVNGFRYASLDTSPSNGAYYPNYPSSTSIDYAELAPNIVARTHTRNYVGDNGPRGSYSLDGGVTWTRFPTEPGGAADSGVIAVAADGSRLVWTPAGEGVYYSALTNAGTFYSTNFGTTWLASTGVPEFLNPVADRVNPGKFYAYDPIHGVVYVSTNGGAAFSAGASGLPTLPSYNTTSAVLKAVFGQEGNLWLTAGNGTALMRSTNSGAAFTVVSTVAESCNFGFGRAAPGENYPAIFVAGTVAGVYGFFQSDDQGATWARINDDEHQFGAVYCLTGDPKFYGRVYVGTGGRGAVYADPVNPVAPGLQFPAWNGANLLLPFASESGFDYVLQQTSNLGAAPWSNLTTNAGTGGTLDLPAPFAPSIPQEWFRLKTQPPQ